MKKKVNDFLYEKETYIIRGALFSVWKQLGCGFKENVYHNALKEEFIKSKIPFVSEPRIDIIYNEKKVGTYKPDFLLFNKIILEIKCISILTKLEDKQLWYYLKGSNYKLAFIANFGAQKLEIRRWVYDKAREKYLRLEAS